MCVDAGACPGRAQARRHRGRVRARTPPPRLLSSSLLSFLTRLLCSALGSARDEAAAAKNASPSLDFLDLDSPDALLRFLSAPCPKKAGIVQCHIRRRKGGTYTSVPLSLVSIPCSPLGSESAWMVTRTIDLA